MLFCFIFTSGSCLCLLSIHVSLGYCSNNASNNWVYVAHTDTIHKFLRSRRLQVLTVVGSLEVYKPCGIQLICRRGGGIQHFLCQSGLVLLRKKKTLCNISSQPVW